MKERPILFSAPMVRALLDGRKTQTRRVVKPQPDHCHRDIIGKRPPYDPGDFARLIPQLGDTEIKCPYGAPGSRLWVKETWREREPDQDGTSLEFRADRPEYKSRADDPCSVPWRASIHMPRRASRITLEITGVRVERLHDISRDDSIAEGLSFVGDGGSCWGIPGIASSWRGDPRASYRALWEAINGADSWAANPWVWVINFKRVPA